MIRSFQRLRCVCFAMATMAFAHAAEPGPLLSCKADAQQTCSASGCEAQQPTTQTELDIDLRSGKPTVCYGTACWRTAWSRLDWSRQGQLVTALTSATSFNGKPERLWLQATIALDGLRFQATILDDPGSVEVFSGACTCRNGPAGNTGCVSPGPHRSFPR